MPNYKKMYHIMFNAATDAERLAAEAEQMAIEAKDLAVKAAHMATDAERLTGDAMDVLTAAQQECEEVYVESANAEVRLMPGTKAVGE